LVFFCPKNLPKWPTVIRSTGANIGSFVFFSNNFSKFQ